ncbi:MAG: glycoside hydrolase family 13 protein [Nocardioides sp.]
MAGTQSPEPVTSPVPVNPPAPWWHHAVIYQVYVRSFADSDGDGIGDLPGITAHLDHLVELGVDALWITPFYRSPQHDHGYDVADYRAVDPLFGSLGDADALVARAHELGLRVIVDIVPNHTSSGHAWFLAALAAGPGSPERGRYLFRDGQGPGGDQPPNNWLSVFGGLAWDRVVEADGSPGQWYLHLFDSSQPDLDWRNPEVRAEFEDVLRFWLDRGVDGFRIDVAHSLIKVADLRDQIRDSDDRTAPILTDEGALVDPHVEDEPMWDQSEVHDIYRDWHRVLAAYPGDRMTVAEAWTRTPESMARYVRPDELSQSFNFAWLSTGWSAEAFRQVIEDTFSALDPVGSPPTWVLSNHDVIRHVTRYGGGERGLARARAGTLTMLGLPGSAYLYQGEELGLEQADVPVEARQDPIALRTGEVGRDGCRVPLPWGGTEPPYDFGPGVGQPWLPQPSDWAGLTVAAQAADPASTFSFYRAALRLRRLLPAEGIVMATSDPAGVLSYTRGDVRVVLNTGTVPVPLPAGDVLIASGPISQSGLSQSGSSQSGLSLPPDTAVWLRGGA